MVLGRIGLNKCALTNVTRSSFVADCVCHSLALPLSADLCQAAFSTACRCPRLSVWDREQYVTFQLEQLGSLQEAPLEFGVLN